jgi:hypothetical protein
LPQASRARASSSGSSSAPASNSAIRSSV